jgi:hypothetical protein
VTFIHGISKQAAGVRPAADLAADARWCGNSAAFG